jgi:hypothetical protein
MFMSGADIAVLVSAFIAAWLVLRTLLDGQRSKSTVIAADSRNVDSIFPLLLVFFAFFALLLIAYLTHQQPIIFPRYGLILFSLGIPILAWTHLAITRHRPEWSRRILTTIIVLCALNWSAQFAGAIGELNRYSAQRKVADYLRDHFDQKSDAKIFCDEDTVKVLSGIPEESFLSSADFSKTEALAMFLNQSKIEYLVYAKRQGLIAMKALPNAESREPDGYVIVVHSYTDFLFTDIWVFRASDR